MVDHLLAWMMRPSVRRFRRSAFLITLPVAGIVAHFYGVGHGVLAVALRLTLWAAAVIAAWRVGGERGAKDMPDVIRSEPAEFELAEEKKGRYVLAVVWGLEASREPD